jgi:cell division protein FtsB
MDAKFTKSLVLSAILLLISASLITGTLKIAQKSKRLIEAKQELELLRQEKDRLDREVAYRQSPEFVEKEARNKLNMVKPGEEVYLKPKISGDDLLGAQDTRAGGSEAGTAEVGSAKPGFFAPVTAWIGGLFDKIKAFLLLFQS